ncbi:MAG: DUF1552 domain-containing protein [Acidobacteriota bacterium]
MFITRKSLPRRTFLRGVGVTVALPLLDSMVPALTALGRSAARPRRRFGAVYIPNGVIMDKWTPQGGRDFELTPILKPLEPFREHLTVVSNLSRVDDGTLNDHTASQASWLAGVLPKRTEAEDVRLGVTIDQIIARQIGQDSLFPSLEVATENFTGYIGACTPGYSCAYMNTISWTSPTTPLPMEVNPRVLFERLFGGSGTLAQRLRSMKEDRSILDSITEDAEELQRGLPAHDRVRVGEYLDTVREIERRIQRAEGQSRSQLTGLDAPVGVPEAFDEHVGLLFDLLVIAYQADLSAVFTFLMAREASNRAYPQIGVPEPHHLVSHHGNKPDKIAEHAKINTYHVMQLAKFVEKLRATPDGDGSLLDHSAILYGSGMSNGNQHSGEPLPLLVIGGAAGPGNRHLELPAHTSMANFLLGMVGKFDVPVEAVGDSNGRVEL